MTENFEALDTTVVQVRSVLNFMYALGYRLDETGKSGRFVSEHPAFKANKYLSFSTATKMHNLRDDQWVVYDNGVAVPNFINLSSGFSTIGVRLAQASKLVDQVKLSINKSGTLITMSPMVKPLNKIVEGLLSL